MYKSRTIYGDGGGVASSGIFAPSVFAEGQNAAPWYLAGGTIDIANVLEWVENPAKRQLFVGGTATGAWTIAVRTSIAIAENRFALDSQTGRVVLGFSATLQNGFYVGGGWNDVALFPIDGAEYIYFLISDGANVQAYRDGATVGGAVVGATDFNNGGVTRWRGAYTNNSAWDWLAEVPLGAVYNIALDATQRAGLLAAMGGT